MDINGQTAISMKVKSNIFQEGSQEDEFELLNVDTLKSGHFLVCPNAIALKQDTSLIRGHRSHKLSTLGAPLCKTSHVTPQHVDSESTQDSLA